MGGAHRKAVRKLIAARIEKDPRLGASVRRWLTRDLSSTLAAEQNREGAHRKKRAPPHVHPDVSVHVSQGSGDHEPVASSAQRTPPYRGPASRIGKASPDAPSTRRSWLEEIFDLLLQGELFAIVKADRHEAHEAAPVDEER